MIGYVGRFAPSPTGPLHAGSLVAALASRLDALAHSGRWLLRIEDIDRPREVPGAARHIIDTLAALGFEPDGRIVFQHEREAAYQDAFASLQSLQRVYPCACSRREIADSLTVTGRVRMRHAQPVYPGTCRDGLPDGRAPRSWRLRVGETIEWRDRSGRRIRESLPEDVGDFVLRKADGLWAYQLAVVVDDGWQGVTDVVRGDDLIGSTGRQLLLQRLLGLAQPRYLHLPVVLGPDGEKLSKQNGAQGIDLSDPVQALERALTQLGLPVTGAVSLSGFWRTATELWQASGWMKTPPAD